VAVDCGTWVNLIICIHHLTFSFVESSVKNNLARSAIPGSGSSRPFTNFPTVVDHHIEDYMRLYQHFLPEYQIPSEAFVQILVILADDVTERDCDIA
jgi:hypothetical protein